MRTTITIDDDVAAKLNQEVRRTGLSFKGVVNEVLRRGLLRKPEASSLPPFIVRSKRLGLRAGLSYDNIEELLDAVEKPTRR